MLPMAVCFTSEYLQSFTTSFLRDKIELVSRRCRSVPLLLSRACELPGDLVQCRFWFSRSRVGPDILHFQRAPGSCCSSTDHPLNSKLVESSSKGDCLAPVISPFSGRDPSRQEFATRGPYVLIGLTRLISSSPRLSELEIKEESNFPLSCDEAQDIRLQSHQSREKASKKAKRRHAEKNIQVPCQPLVKLTPDPLPASL